MKEVRPIVNDRQSEVTSAALRATKQEVRTREFFRGLSSIFPKPVHGEAIHVEAFGSVLINIAHRLSAAQCASLPEHEHCTREMPDHNHERPKGDLPAECPPREHTHEMEPDAVSCCLIPEPFPMSVYFDVPMGYAMALPLGDALILTVRRPMSGELINFG